MNLYKNLVLVGMMASGKSTIGKKLSKKLKFGYIDTDSIVEKTEKKTISEIFEKNGEKYFRHLEENITLKSLKLRNTVIALGGGGFINSSIRRYTLDKCISVWLDWNNENLIKRIKNSKKRPLASKFNSSKLRRLIKKRATIYNLSNYKIKCDKLNKEQIVNKIIEIYENSKNKD
tara:strand:+ start:43 stop:567 length:525 start_codon:yes stop_codon:yes gene_type:complete